MVIKHDAYCSSATSDNALLELFNANFEHWFKYITDTNSGLGVDINERDLVVVTKRFLTKDWAMSTFKRSSQKIKLSIDANAPQVSFHAGGWVKWESKTKIPHRSGPGPLEPVPAGANAFTKDKFDQCIFLTASRRFSRKKRMLRKIVRAVRPKPDGSNIFRSFIDFVRKSPAEGNADERLTSSATTSNSRLVRRH